MRFFAFLLSTLLASSTLWAATGFDINDVAVLFPNDGLHKPIPYISLDEAALIDPKILTAVLDRAAAIGIKAPQTTAMAKPADFSIRAFRIDPCAPEEHGLSSEPCLFELRLIAQPTARFSPADTTLHLIYKLGSGKPTAQNPVLIDLQKLKIESETVSRLSTNGFPLGVHPVLAASAKTKRTNIPLLFANFVRKYARVEALSKVTMMGLRNGSPTNWIFFGGDIIDGKWLSTPVPNRKLIRSQNNFVELNVNEGAESFKGTAVDGKLSLDQFFNQTPDDVTSDLNAIAETAFTLENPDLTNRNTVDCVSCHAATSMRLATDFVFPTEVEGVMSRVPKGITAFPAMGTVQNHPLHWNLRAFGYFGLTPTVSLRAVHEAADSAEQINTILGLTAPGSDCSAVYKDVLQCFVTGTLEPWTVNGETNCLAKCERIIR
ncbi:MAG: hypothetical protein EOP10_09005 [Proteobacteria bacterium]|nr:MAG: hypothetical protein EOP10_09005 [Pseudomonadota bacterium]